MKKRFTNKCFIRKNTDFLRKTLINLGYEDRTQNKKSRFLFTNIDEDGTPYFGTGAEKTCRALLDDAVDCQSSETLFLAVAAINEDDDKFQFFTTLQSQHFLGSNHLIPRGSLILCMVTDMYMGNNPLENRHVLSSRKATVEELVSSFSETKKEEFYRSIPSEMWGDKTENDHNKYALNEEEKAQLADIFKEIEAKNDIPIYSVESLQ